MVLIMELINNIAKAHGLFRANSEVSALLGRIPSAIGYQPTLATDLGGLQEHIAKSPDKDDSTIVQVAHVNIPFLLQL
ncbi:hypothetical protein L6452_28117 [Arctium lappa]|uniref:Uncharacterized protein n=1 Tax=Arctium lappa TaxID=4217 RepID=A0ACB8ZXL3_ARCLA|nr:hypothetical protein L6452_28117 [Arctium lappa]